ncbi:hypothetical protein [Thalassomonas sp. M1454]|uniref:hypothetical protein n=1 Tax=Thalassomonas sp. M1454 TaxID=2594477 RepID=UPI00117CA101|nr:hypothetical protein [Thalassomonas sp. M1454]TRX55646.1 hypothetical protein FNN08_08405 [Thalassomonas sp. M1454]
MQFEHQAVDVPFHFRHCCWFCNEPAAAELNFPSQKSLLIDCPHPAISLPCCDECKRFARQSDAHSIWTCRESVKKSLMKRYRKDLAIGKNWTQEELANSEFEGGNFAGFAKSAWFVFEVARDRVNFSGWPLWCNGEQIENITEGKEFIFDGVSYTDIYQAIDFYVATYGLDKEFLLQVVKIVGIDRFAYAIRFCRLYIGHTPNEKRAALKELS